MSFNGLSSFFIGLKNKTCDNKAVKQFLTDLLDLPDLADIPADAPAMPILRDIAALSAGIKVPAYPGGGILGTRLESRYRRICFVHQELGKLDFKQAKPGMRFDDFVFEQTDFGIYKKIPREDFYLFYEAGLNDFDDAFYKKNFGINRSAVRTIINRMYRQIDASYCCKKEEILQNPLFISIMRTLHTSLEFAPLIDSGELLRECTGLIRFLLGQSDMDKDLFFYLARGFNELFCRILCNLHNAVLTHSDGMNTTLFIAPADDTGNSALSLWGTFRPDNKAHTISLVSTAMPFSAFHSEEL
jgi:hypothetical protein